MVWYTLFCWIYMLGFEDKLTDDEKYILSVILFKSSFTMNILIVMLEVKIITIIPTKVFVKMFIQNSDDDWGDYTDKEEFEFAICFFLRLSKSEKTTPQYYQT